MTHLAGNLLKLGIAALVFYMALKVGHMNAVAR